MKLLKILNLVLVATMLMSSVASATPIREVRMAAGREGTNIHASMLGIVSVVNPILEPKGIRLVPTTTAGSTASIRMLNRGEVDFAFAGTTDMLEAHSQTGAFATSNLRILPLQGIFYANINALPAVRPDSPIQNFSDMVGKRFFPFDAASSVFQIYRAMFTALGTWDQMEIRQLDAMEVSDALTMGTLDVVGTHATSNGLAAVAWVRNFDAVSDIRFLEPTEEEREILSKIPGFTVQQIGNEWISERNRQFNPEKIWALAVHYAFFPSPTLPEDVVYEISKALLENSAYMVDITAMMRAFHNYGNPLEWTLNGIQEIYNIPVHPGLARYLKSVGAWNDAWTIGEIQER